MRRLSLVLVGCLFSITPFFPSRSSAGLNELNVGSFQDGRNGDLLDIFHKDGITSHPGEIRARPLSRTRRGRLFRQLNPLYAGAEGDGYYVEPDPFALASHLFRDEARFFAVNFIDEVDDQGRLSGAWKSRDEDVSPPLTFVAFNVFHRFRTKIIMDFIGTWDFIKRRSSKPNI